MLGLVTPEPLVVAQGGCTPGVVADHLLDREDLRDEPGESVDGRIENLS